LVSKDDEFSKNIQILEFGKSIVVFAFPKGTELHSISHTSTDQDLCFLRNVWSYCIRAFGKFQCLCLRVNTFSQRYLDFPLPQVQTDFQQLTDTQFVITIPDADNINHLVVFLTGTSPFPEGFGGSGWFKVQTYVK